MWFKIVSYLNFLLQSSNKHGVHSPFTFAFYTNCLLKKTDPTVQRKLNAIKETLNSNNSYIDVEDFGSGSTVFKRNRRKISRISRVAGISSRKSASLSNTIGFLKPASILEIGTSVGLATSCMSLANSATKILTIEGCKHTAAVAQDIFKKFQLNNIELKVGKFDEELPKLVANNKFDLIYFDGNHDKEATLNYFEICLKMRNEDAVFIFDDIYWSEGMLNAWNRIVEHREVTVSINTHYWGIVFFNKRLANQKYKLRC